MTLLDRWAAQCAEWDLIRAERPDLDTPFRVTIEQRKRMLARGEHLVTKAEIDAEKPLEAAGD